MHLRESLQQSGAVEACWAHNPEVRGSKPRSASLAFGQSWCPILRPAVANSALIDIKTWKRRERILDLRDSLQQSGAVEACWAHNPEVRGSKPRSASLAFGQSWWPILRPAVANSALIDRKTWKRRERILHLRDSLQQSGAVEACWAHNPEVRGSKPRSASLAFGQSWWPILRPAVANSALIDRKTWKRWERILHHRDSLQQSGAVEACWAHNPEVRGSKPRSASLAFGQSWWPILRPAVANSALIDIKTWKRRERILDLIDSLQQSGAVEACWAHNPEFRGSKPRSASLAFGQSWWLILRPAVANSALIDRKTWKRRERILDLIDSLQQSGAVEACWAHNPEVRGSKPRSASLAFGQSWWPILRPAVANSALIDIKTWKRWERILHLIDSLQQSGAVEACWAHNPEVRGSKPRSASLAFGQSWWPILRPAVANSALIDRKTWKRRERILDLIDSLQQSGAVEACWAHNPEVRGSKPRSASLAFGQSWWPILRPAVANSALIDRKTWKRRERILHHRDSLQQSGAVEACWAHNPEVRGSKPRSASLAFGQSWWPILRPAVANSALIDIKTWKRRERILDLIDSLQQSGAVEACWAHNPEFRGSKPRSASLAFGQSWWLILRPAVANSALIDRKTWKRRERILDLIDSLQQSGAVEACWAHNPEVRGSKPRSASLAFGQSWWPILRPAVANSALIDIKTWKRWERILHLIDSLQQSGAVEACWAHNPEVRGSKPRSASLAFGQSWWPILRPAVANSALIDRKTWKRRERILDLIDSLQQSGAVEACWAHNPEVRGSKPRSASLAFGQSWWPILRPAVANSALIDRKTWKRRERILHHRDSLQQSGAVESCWAHNPEVRGSKPRSASLAFGQSWWPILRPAVANSALIYIKTWKRRERILHHRDSLQQSGAVEACWAHNPEVRGSKPRSASLAFGQSWCPILRPAVANSALIDIKTWKRRERILHLRDSLQQSGAVEACWAHNPEVRGSKPRSASLAFGQSWWPILRPAVANSALIDIKTWKRRERILHLRDSLQQSGAVEACWAHNPEVRGSKPRSASLAFGHSWWSILRPAVASSALIDRKTWKRWERILHLIDSLQQSGAVEACWAHNPEVRGSKPRSASLAFGHSWWQILRPAVANSALIDRKKSKR